MTQEDSNKRDTMAAHQEVIELLDSDNEEKSVSLNERADLSGASVRESIDLCESSDDEPQSRTTITSNADTALKAASLARRRVTKSPLNEASLGNGICVSLSVARKPSMQSSRFDGDEDDVSSDSDDDDDDELLKGGPIFSSNSAKKPAAFKTPTTSSTSKQVIVNPYRSSATHRSTLDGDGSAQKPPARSSTTTPGGAKMQVVNPYRSSTTKTTVTVTNPYRSSASRAPSAASRNSSMHTNNNDDDDDEEDDSLYLNIRGLNGAAHKTPQAHTAAPMRTSSTVATAAAASRNINSSLSSSSSRSLRRQQQAAVDAPFQYPKLLPNSKRYPDERARYALAFWKFGRSQTIHSYQRPKLDVAAKRLVQLAVCEEYPVRSLEEYSLFGKSTSVATARNARDEVQGWLTQGGVDAIHTPVTADTDGTRLYYTIAEACLVVLKTHVEHCIRHKGDDPKMLSLLDDEAKSEFLKNDKELWMPLSDLIPAIDRLLRPECPGTLTRQGETDYGASHYLQQSTRSLEFLQIVKLETNLDTSGPLIKRHKYKGLVHYELLSAGLKSATMIQTRQFPEPPGHYRCSRIATLSQVREEYEGVCLGVDLREGGGGTNKLHQLCNKLDMVHVPFMVGSLQIGDYVFFTRKTGAPPTDPLNYLCPILVERKSVQDVAMSIADGRWTSQKRRMYVGQYVFGYDNCRMMFIIEGNENAQTVSGDYVGARHFQVDKEKLAEEIKNLEEEGFEVKRTPSRENTMFELARWAQQIAKDMKSGALKAQFTYEEFKQECAMIGRTVDFSRLAKEHYRQKKELQESLKRSAGDDSDIEILDPPPGSRGPPMSGTSTKKQSSRKKQKAEKDEDEFSGLSSKQLQEECSKVGMKKSGNRTELIARLKDTSKHPPKLLLRRKLKGEYVPERHNVGASALLVALYLHERNVGAADYDGLSKEELYVKAEGLNITKNPFSGGTTQTGPYHYDGWANMSKLLQGDPPLVVKRKGKYKLTRNSDLSGYDIAEAVHAWNHGYNNCPCEDHL